MNLNEVLPRQLPREWAPGVKASAAEILLFLLDFPFFKKIIYVLTYLSIFLFITRNKLGVFLKKKQAKIRVKKKIIKVGGI